MRARIISIDEERPAWKGRALGAFAVVAALGVGGWQFAKWWQNPIDHENMKSDKSQTVIENAEIFYSLAQITKGIHVDNQNDKTDAVLSAEFSGTQQSSLQDSLDKCRAKRMTREKYSAYQATQTDHVKRLAYLDSQWQQNMYQQTMGLSTDDFRNLLVLQAQATMRFMWEQQKDPGLDALSRYVILDDIIYAYSVAVMMSSDKQKDHTEDIAEAAGFTMLELDRVRQPLKAPALQQIANFWQGLPPELDLSSELAQKYRTTRRIFSMEILPESKKWIPDQAQQKQLHSQYESFIKRYGEYVQKLQPADYHCAGISIPQPN